MGRQSGKRKAGGISSSASEPDEPDPKRDFDVDDVEKYNQFAESASIAEQDAEAEGAGSGGGRPQQVLTEEQKKEERARRNRASALKSRNKRRQRLAFLEEAHAKQIERIRELERQNAHLLRENARLRAMPRTAEVEVPLPFVAPFMAAPPSAAPGIPRQMGGANASISTAGANRQQQRQQGRPPVPAFANSVTSSPANGNGHRNGSGIDSAGTAQVVGRSHGGVTSGAPAPPPIAALKARSPPISFANFDAVVDLATNQLKNLARSRTRA